LGVDVSQLAPHFGQVFGVVGFQVVLELNDDMVTLQTNGLAHR
jgi:hypothetical protein